MKNSFINIITIVIAILSFKVMYKYLHYSFSSVILAVALISLVLITVLRIFILNHNK